MKMNKGNTPIQTDVTQFNCGSTNHRKEPKRTEKDRKRPKRAEKDRKRPKRAEKDQKELDKKSRKGPKRTGYIDPKRTIIETKIWIIFTQELI